MGRNGATKRKAWNVSTRVWQRVSFRLKGSYACLYVPAGQNEYQALYKSVFSPRYSLRSCQEENYWALFILRQRRNRDTQILKLPLWVAALPLVKAPFPYTLNRNVGGTLSRSKSDGEEKNICFCRYSSPGYPPVVLISLSPACYFKNREITDGLKICKKEKWMQNGTVAKCGSTNNDQWRGFVKTV
jgi:hypothetical protein